MEETSEIRQRKMLAIGSFTGAMVHDFNNIWAILQGYVHLLQKRTDSDEKMVAITRALSLATTRGVVLTQRLTDFIRDKSENADAECDALALTLENRELIQPLLGSRIPLSIQLPSEMTDDALHVRCSADEWILLLMAWAHHAKNVVQHTGTAVIKFSGDAEKFCICFCLRCEEKNRDEAGIRTLQDFAAAKNGTLHVHDTSRGLDIEMHLPRVLKAPVGDVLSNGARNLLRNKTVLIVDDEEALLPILQDQLEELGMKVLQAANADSALLLQEDYPDPIDFLLTDIVMPGVDGIRLAEMITDARPGTNVVYMTGYADHPDGKRFIKSLSEDSLIVSKPLLPGTLSDALERALEKVEDM